jgi:hypothetical protein
MELARIAIRLQSRLRVVTRQQGHNKLGKLRNFWSGGDLVDVAWRFLLGQNALQLLFAEP